MRRPLALALALAALGPLVAEAQSVRAPYLQQGTSDGVTVVWRTAAPEDSVVCWGASPDALTVTATGPTGRDHVVRIDGLEADTRWYYAISPGGACPVAGDADHFFRTAPAPGTPRPFSMWVVGDSGTGGSRQRAVFAAMRDVTGGASPDLFLHVGDMAYSDGTTSEFDRNFFDVYAPLLRNTVVWPAMGNHEGHTSVSATQSGPYYEAYVLPVDGAAGGLPSGTEAYYAFDYGNVHFIVLDSHQSDRAIDGPMLRWMQMDLAATAADWIVAYWHHPAYTDGSHDSDREGALIDMRENALPILEAAGVDVVLAGHSHIYERSYLLHGAYDTPTSAAGHILDMGDGRPDGDGAYDANGDGALYVVAGHGGTGVSGAGNHPVMFHSEVDHGSCLIDVAGGSLTLRNIRWDGTETDRVSLVKGDGIAVLAPVGGETFLAGSTVDVLWASTGTSGEVRVEYSLDDGERWAVIADRTPDDGRLAWETPRRQSTRARVRVTDVADASLSATSPASFALSASAEVEVLPFGGTWEYHDQPEAPPSDWDTTTGGWPSGPGQLGYGDGDEATTLLDADPNIASAYFRRTITVDGAVTSARLRVLFDDGFAAFVNGAPVLSRNVDDLAHDAYASTGSMDDELLEMDIDPAAFVDGENVIAVIVKQSSGSSSDLSFDLSLRLGLRVDVEPPPTDAGAPDDDGGSAGDDAAGPDPDGGSTSPPSSDGCGCRVAPSPAGPGLALALLALLAFARRRRSIRRPG